MVRKGDQYVQANNIDADTIMNFRLYPNMLPFKWQVYIATDTAKFAVSRLGEIKAPVLEDNQITFAELDARIEKVLTFLGTVKPEQINGTEEKEITLKSKAGDLKCAGQQYLLGYAIPNLYFHVTTAFAILRHNGVDIGKSDYLGEV